MSQLSFLSTAWCSESARTYDHIICGRASVHIKTDLQLYVYMYLERRYSYMYFEKANIVFLYIMQHLESSGTSKH